MRENLVYEVVFIGLITLVFYSILYRFIGNSEIKVADYNKILLTAFLTGCSLHFIFEITNANDYWCRTTYKLA